MIENLVIDVQFMKVKLRSKVIIAALVIKCGFAISDILESFLVVVNAHHA